MTLTPVRLGYALFTMVDPLRGHEVEYRAIAHRQRPDDRQHVQQAEEGHHQPEDVRDG